MNNMIRSRLVAIARQAIVSGPDLTLPLLFDTFPGSAASFALRTTHESVLTAIFRPAFSVEYAGRLRYALRRANETRVQRSLRYCKPVRAGREQPGSTLPPGDKAADRQAGRLFVESAQVLKFGVSCGTSSRTSTRLAMLRNDSCLTSGFLGRAACGAAAHDVTLRGVSRAAISSSCRHVAGQSSPRRFLSNAWRRPLRDPPVTRRTCAGSCSTDVSAACRGVQTYSFAARSAHHEAILCQMRDASPRPVPIPAARSTGPTLRIITSRHPSDRHSGFPCSSGPPLA